MSSETAPADLNTKYQKLATEYAKLRSQIIVLKKGVLDEQEKNAHSSDQIHEKDMQLRKQESEMESVLFRNQQLTKRVNILQEEIDNAQAKPKSRWRGSNNEDKEKNHDRVINEELVAKITENARLHATLDDIEKQYETTIQTLQNRVQVLENEKTTLGAEKKSQESENNESLSAITKENDELRSRVTLLERDLAVRSKQNETMEVELAVALQKNRSYENVCRVEASTQYTFIDSKIEQQKEERERQITSLQFRLDESLARLQEAERDREHWKLEYQLKQMKLQKSSPSGDDSSQNQEENDEGSDVTMKEMFEARIGSLLEDRVESDSRATSFYLECQALDLKVEALESELETTSEELDQKRDLLTRGEEETRTMQLNYEEQLSVMSDHLAEMNSKLAAQEDTIIELRQSPDPADKKKKKK